MVTDAEDLRAMKVGGTHVRGGARWPLSCSDEASASRLMSAVEIRLAVS